MTQDRRRWQRRKVHGGQLGLNLFLSFGLSLCIFGVGVALNWDGAGFLTPALTRSCTEGAREGSRPGCGGCRQPLAIPKQGDLAGSCQQPTLLQLEEGVGGGGVLHMGSVPHILHKARMVPFMWNYPFVLQYVCAMVCWEMFNHQPGGVVVYVVWEAIALICNPCWLLW